MPASELPNIMMTVASKILGDRALCFPWYRPEIRSEAQAKAAEATLPLLYSWNEVVQGGQLRSFSVSVNSGKLTAMLQRYLPRSHPEFVATRDELMRLLNQAQNAMMLKLCIQFQAPPNHVSALAGGEMEAA